MTGWSRLVFMINSIISFMQIQPAICLPRGFPVSHRENALDPEYMSELLLFSYWQTRCYGEERGSRRGKG